mgnify:CR=1 FL=1
MSIEKEKLIHRDPIYDGQIIHVFKDTVELAGRETIREVVLHQGAAAIIPVTDKGEVLFVKQYRYPVEEALLEIPAGKMDPGETPDQCAARELEEETGYRSDDLEWLITLRTTVALCNEKIEVYVARNLIRTHQHLDENEFVNVEAHTVEELKQMIFEGKIEDSKTVAAILAYDAKYNR